MGQLFFMDENGCRWMCGWDNPTGGYFAQRFNPEPSPVECPGCPEPEQDWDCNNCPIDAHEQFDVLVGYGKGIPDLDVLAATLVDFGFTIQPAERAAMKRDRKACERPLSPMQERVNQLFASLDVGGTIDLRRKDV